MRLIYVFVVFLVFSFVSAPVAAQQRITPQLALARICASEVGMNGDIDRTLSECAAIYAVLTGRAERTGMSFMTMARAYSSSVFDTTRRDQRMYIPHLRPDGREPHGWPTQISVRRRDGTVRITDHAPWSAYRERWLALYEGAGRIVRGEVTSACSEAPDHWGMSHAWSVDMQRAERAGWTRMDCGDTRNAFWRVPRSESDS